MTEFFGVYCILLYIIYWKKYNYKKYNYKNFLYVK